MDRYLNVSQIFMMGCLGLGSYDPEDALVAGFCEV